MSLLTCSFDDVELERSPLPDNAYKDREVSNNNTRENYMYTRTTNEANEFQGCGTASTSSEC